MSRIKDICDFMGKRKGHSRYFILRRELEKELKIIHRQGEWSKLSDLDIANWDEIILWAASFSRTKIKVKVLGMFHYKLYDHLDLNYYYNNALTPELIKQINIFNRLIPWRNINAESMKIIGKKYHHKY